MANFRGGLLQLAYLDFHKCPTPAKLADHQRGEVSIRAHPCCPGDIKSIFPDVIDFNLRSCHYASGVGQVQEDRREGWVQEVKVVKARGSAPGMSSELRDAAVSASAQKRKAGFWFEVIAEVVCVSFM